MLDHCWIYNGHALYVTSKPLRIRNDWRSNWEVYYRPFPYARTELAGMAGRQVLAEHEDRDQACKAGETAVDAGDARTPPDVEQTRLKAESLDREDGVAGFIAPEKLPQLDVVPFRYEPAWPPMPPDGLEIGRDDAGTWRTYQERYPASTLTAGHADNIEAYWACHVLRDLAPWAITIDVRAEAEGEPSRCRLEREILAGRVDAAGKRYASWRSTIHPEPKAPREVKGAPGLVLVNAGRGDWSVVRSVDSRRLLGGIGSQAKAATAARALAALGDLVTVPVYVLPHLPALREDVKAIEWEAAGLSLEAPQWAQRHRARAAEIREAVAKEAAREAAREAALRRR
ncbi:hypothetical protein ACG83_10090 [Frankia sp. R43]|nr:hypothetical protein ACG83_10090 [Frankia sp. R43]